MIEEAKALKRSALEGRVAQILNATELVINIGSDAGVKPGVRFRVLSEDPIQIIDPASKIVLDSIPREKVRVEAAEVRPKITICRTYRKSSTPGGPLWGYFTSDLYAPPKEVVETIKGDDASFPTLPPERSYVSINDRVVEVME